jgi:protein-S-isoprenylcysteine O-methyltransferase Ste14
MQAEIQRWVGMLWIGFLVVWTVAALLQKQTVRRDSTLSRLLQLFLAALAFMLLARPDLNFGFLAKPFVPVNIFFSFLGLSLTILGFAIAIWARVMLGGNWSAAVTVKKDHELVRNGPYALVRHPIYSGALLALLGTAIVFHGLRGLLALAVALLALRLKSLREEVFMTEQFGAEYMNYMKKVKALVPFVW